MLFNGFANLFSLLAGLGSDFWFALLFFYPFFFCVCSAIVYSFTPRGRVLKTAKRLRRFQKVSPRNALLFLRKEKSAQKRLQKGVDLLSRTSQNAYGEFVWLFAYFGSSNALRALCAALLSYSFSSWNDLFFSLFFTSLLVWTWGLSLAAFLFKRKKSFFIAAADLRAFTFRSVAKDAGA